MRKKKKELELAKSEKLREAIQDLLKTHGFGSCVDNVYIDHRYKDVTIDVTDRSEIPATFNIFSALSELLGTRKIDLGSFSKTRGCETCDYGSELSATYVCREVDIDAAVEKMSKTLC